MSLLTPITSAKRKTRVRVFTPFDSPLYDHSVTLPNGHIKVDKGFKFTWIAEDGVTVLGYADQYVLGIDKGDQAMLRGYGVFTSTIADKLGTITYTIGNNYDADNVFWAGRLKIVDGTGYFEGLKGQGELIFELMAFDLYLDYDPWA